MDRPDQAFRLPGSAVSHLLSVDRDVWPPSSLAEFPRAIPEAGIGENATLNLIAPFVLGNATDLGSDTYFAHMDPPTPWVTWVTSFWNAAMNQNLLHPDTGPAAREVERRVLEWIAPPFGANGGHFVPGSTVANLTALWAARELRNVTQVVASRDAHISIRKAARILGLDYREVDVNDARQLRIDGLGDLSSSALVLTAGTTAAGAIDPLRTGQDAAWRHVDAAWAGPLRFSSQYALLLDGIDQADSVAISAHKWFFQPKESALVLFRDYENVTSVLSFGGGYLATPNVGILGSHGAAAISLYATLLAWGREGLEERLHRCMDSAKQLAQLVESSDDFLLFNPPTTGVVLWKPKGIPVEEARAIIDSATLSTTVVDGVQWFRSVAANPMVDTEKFFNAIHNRLSKA
jgi:L-2,4-diaminobutyrate decarboxylase